MIIFCSKSNIYKGLLFLSFFVLSTSFANASTSLLSQTDKEDSLSFNIEYVQTLGCSDVTGKVDQITISMTRTSLFSANWRAELLGAGVFAPTFTADETVILGPRYEPTDLTFNFGDPVDVANELCINGATRFMMRIVPDKTDQNMTALMNGSYDNPYLNGYYSFNNTSTSDIYFIIRMQNDDNSQPSLEPIVSQVAFEGSQLGFTASAVDPDNDTLTYSATGLPSGATLDPVTGAFSWTPTYEQAGTYDVTLTVTDDGDPALSDSETVTITVNNTNQSPELTPVGNKTVIEGENLTFTISATDPDGDTLTYSANNLPPGAAFNPATRTFTWTPTFAQAGNYSDIEFTVIDNGIPIALDMELITITVGDVNRAPEIVNPGPQEVVETETLTFSVSATDPDGDNVSVTAANLPISATFDGGIFSWTPTLSQEGIYVVTFTVTDTGIPQTNSSIDVVITVGDNPTPVEQAENLVDDVITLDIPQNVENSYLANLLKVEEFIEEGKITAAINQLDAFINKVNQDRQQGILTQAEANALIDAAEDLIADLVS